MLVTPTPRAASLPTDRALDAAVVALAERGDNAGLVQLVEAWSAYGAPSQAARLAQGRAFFHLRMMDRAVARLREVIEQEPGHPEALLCLAEVYVERGWPQRARAPLTQLRDAGLHSVLIDTLWERANLDPVRPDLNARQIEREGDPVRLIELAEAFLATGSFLRGRGILERLRRNDPENARVRELLWGLSGETTPADVSLAQLLRNLLPLPPIPPTVIAREEPEHTDSFSETTQSSIAEGGLQDLDALAFPSLFKQSPRVVESADEGGEHTAASSVATTDEMLDGGDPEGTDAGRSSSQHGDTQIRLVLRPGEEARQAHRRRDGDDALRSSLNLREYQESMGMSDGSSGDLGHVDVEEEERSEVLPRAAPAAEPEPEHREDDLLEEEDENLVVMTRVEADPEPAPQAPLQFDTPIEVLERHPVPVVAPPPPAWSDLPSVEPQPLSPSSRWAILGVAAAALAMMLAFGLIAGSQLWQLAAGGGPRADLLEALEGGDYESLLRLEGALETRARAAADPAVTAALAEARLILWSEFNGDRERLDYVRGVVASPETGDVHRTAMLRAAYALATEDEPGARAALSRQEPKDDEERLLFARLAAEEGDTSRALELFGAMREPEAPRYALARAAVLSAAGKLPEARALVASVLADQPTHRAAGLAQAALAEGAPVDRIMQINLFMSRFHGVDLPPRVGGEAQALRAQAYLELGLQGKAREAADLGLARDGTHPALLLIVAEDEARQGRLDRALAELESVVGARPGHAEAQAARVLTLLDLDRVREAEEAVAALREAKLLPQVTPILQGLVTAWGRGAPLAVPIGAKEAGTPLGAWLTAVVAVQERQPDAGAAVSNAVALLQASTSPFELRLVERAKALQVLATSGADADALAEALAPVVATDPVAQVLLGRHYEATGRRARAAQHFDRAVVSGPKVGLAWYERWRFYADARDTRARSAEAARAYLELAPSGPRAERVAAAERRP